MHTTLEPCPSIGRAIPQAPHELPCQDPLSPLQRAAGGHLEGFVPFRREEPHRIGCRTVSEAGRLAPDV